MLISSSEAEHATLNISLSAAVKKNREDQKQLTKKDKKIKELKNTLQKVRILRDLSFPKGLYELMRAEADLIRWDAQK